MDVLNMAFAMFEQHKIEFFEHLNPALTVSATISALDKNAEAEVELTAEEIAGVKKELPLISDEEQRQLAHDTLISDANEKSKFDDGLEQCTFCQSLCPPPEKICDFCRVNWWELAQKNSAKFSDPAAYTLFRRKVQRKYYERISALAQEGSPRAQCMIRLLQTRAEERDVDNDFRRPRLSELIWSPNDYHVNYFHHTGDNQRYTAGIVFYRVQMPFHFELYGYRESIAKILATALGKELDDNDFRVILTES